jgi:hypothetical protein
MIRNLAHSGLKKICCKQNIPSEYTLLYNLIYISLGLFNIIFSSQNESIKVSKLIKSYLLTFAKFSGKLLSYNQHNYAIVLFLSYQMFYFLENVLLVWIALRITHTLSAQQPSFLWLGPALLTFNLGLLKGQMNKPLIWRQSFKIRQKKLFLLLLLFLAVT